MMHALKNRSAGGRVIVALDVAPDQVVPIVIACRRAGVERYKIGSMLSDAIGAPQAIELVQNEGGRVMYDPKRYEIPDVMLANARVIAGHGVEMFTVHASAKEKGVKAAVEGAGKSCIVIGVTVLTSFSDAECQELFGRSPVAQVALFCQELIRAGAKAVVCSPKELEVVRETGLVVITPGVRPIWAAANDQKRIMTPTEAIHAGADLLVIDRPITNPPTSSGLKGPEEAARAIIKEIEGALATR